MADFLNLRYSIQNLNRFIKENAYKGNTFENQTIYNILARDFCEEIFKAKEMGFSADGLMELLKAENMDMGNYETFIDEMNKGFIVEKMVLN